jgi:hypothetical protein
LASIPKNRAFMQDEASTPDPSPSGAPQPSPLAGATPKAPSRRRPRWLKVLLLVFVGILIFIAILPTLLSMGWARQIVENKANEKLAGRLHIDDWSLGWFTGTKIGPLDLSDSSGKPVLQLASVDTHLSLSDVILGHYDLGKVPVSGLRLYITREPDGTLNIQKILPPSAPTKPAPPSEHPAPPSPPSPPSGPSPSAAPSKLPNISVDLVLSDCQAVFTDATTGRSVTFPISGSINIPDINQPITNSLQMAIQPTGSPTAGTISLDGTIAAVHNNQVDSNQPDVDETLKIAGMDLSALQPMLADAFTTLAGHGDGQFALHLQPHNPGSLKGGLTVTQIKAAGKATKNDAFTADAITIATSTVMPTANGLDAIATTTDRLNAGASIVLQQGASKSSVYFAADAVPSALTNLSKNAPPGQSGKVNIGADIDLATIANQLPHLLSLKPGLSLDTGNLKATAGVVMTASDSTPSLSFAIDNVTGKNRGKPIALKPITLTASVTDTGGGGAIPKLQNLAAAFTSAFATGSLTAPEPSQISGQFNAQLADLQSELGQVIDFGASSLRGTIAANISSRGDLAEGNSATGLDKIAGMLTATDIHVDRGSSAPIDVPSVNYTLAATLVRSASMSIEKITGLDVTGAVGLQDHPAIASHFATDLLFGKNSSVVASNVNVTGSIDVPELRHELGTSAADNIPSDYALKWTLGATMAYSNFGSSIDIPSLAITDNHGLVEIQLVGGKDIRFATGESRQRIPPQGTLSISADLAGLEAMVSAADQSVAATLKAGHLDGTLALSGDAQQTKFQEDLRASGLVVRAGKRTTSLAPLELKSTAEYGPGDELRVTDFSAQGAGGEVHLKQPLVFSEQTPGSPAINAELVGSGDVGQAMAFINAFSSAEPPATYTGNYTLDQAVSTSAGVISAKGSVQSNFAIQNHGKVAFAEPEFLLVDDVSYDQAHDVAVLGNLSLDMHNTGALRLAAHGKVSDLGATRTLKDVSADLHYDAAGLWKLIYATLSAEQQKSYADVKVTGTVDRHFLVAGSYPANEPFNVAVQSLTVQGGIAIATFDGKGMSIANLDLPLSLHGGLFFVAEPTPATMNGGTLSLNGTTVDLSDPHERLSIPDNTALLNNISLNAVFLQFAEGWINNPLLIGADKAAGVLNLTIDHCSRLPTDDLVKSTTPENDGAFHMHMVLGKVQIGSPTLEKISNGLSPILGKGIIVNQLQGEIPNYTVNVAKGIMTSDMTMNLTDKKRPLHLNGTVALASQKLNMTLDLPTALFGGENGPLTQALGDNLQIPITGTVDHPNFDLKSIVQKNLLHGGGVGNIIKNITGDKSNSAPSSQPANNPGNDLKGILKGIGG